MDDSPLPPQLLRCVEFIALFLLPESRTRLLTEASVAPDLDESVPLPPFYAVAEHCTLAHVAHGRGTLSWLTTRAAELIGRPVRLVASWAACDESVIVSPVEWARDAGEERCNGEDDATHAVAGVLAGASRGAEHGLGCNAVPHVTVALAQDASARASNVLLERVMSSRSSRTSDVSGGAKPAAAAAALHTWRLTQPVRLWARLGVAVFNPAAPGPPSASRRIIADAREWRQWVASREPLKPGDVAAGDAARSPAARADAPSDATGAAAADSLFSPSGIK